MEAGAPLHDGDAGWSARWGRVRHRESLTCAFGSSLKFICLLIMAQTKISGKRTAACQTQDMNGIFGRMFGSRIAAPFLLPDSIQVLVYSVARQLVQKLSALVWMLVAGLWWRTIVCYLWCLGWADAAEQWPWIEDPRWLKEKDKHKSIQSKASCTIRGQDVELQS